jgi:hypothetical protein
MNKSGQQKSPKWILLGLFLLWLAFVLASYYLVQNAFLSLTIDSIQSVDAWITPRISLGSVGHSLLNIVVAAWISLAALGVGRWLTKIITKTPLTLLEDGLLGFGVGYGAVGLSVLALGLMGLLLKPILFTALALITALTGRATIRFIRQLSFPKPGRIVALILILSLLLALLMALLPATSWDGLFYHLTGPKLYINEGQIVSGIDIPHLNFPSLFEMLYLLALSMGGEPAAILLHFTFALLLIGLVYLMAQRLLAVSNGWFAVFFLLALPMILSLAGWAYNDLALAFYELIALYSLLRWRSDLGSSGILDKLDESVESQPRGNSHSWLIIGAIMTGLAMGLKYTSIIAFLSFAVLLIWWQRDSLRQAIRPMLLYGCLTFLVASPWLIKNTLFTGNPVYPFMFGGDYWDEFRADAYSEGGTGIAFDPESCTDYSPEYLIGQHPTGCDLDFGYLTKRLLLLPFDITLGLRDASLDGPIGPLFLVFLPLILFYVFVRRRNLPRAAWGILFFALTQYAFWTIGVISSAALWQSRLLLPGLLALCPIMAWILEDLARFDTQRFSLQRLLYLVLGGVLLVGLVIQFINLLPHQPWGYILGGETEEQNLLRRLGYHYEAMETINMETPENAVIAFFWEPRSYYCQRDCRPDSILDKYGHMQYLYGDAQGMAESMRGDGITHVLIYEKGLEFVLDANSPGDQPLDEPAILQELRRNYLSPIATIGEDGYTLYELVESK